MTDGNSEALVGIVLKDDNFKIVEVESSTGNQYRINKITESKLDFPFNIQAIQSQDHVSEIAEKIRSTIDSMGFRTNRTILTIPNDFVVIKKYPVDNEFSDEEIIDQVDWEIKQFSYSPDDEYIIDFSRLNSSKTTQYKEIMVVAVRESIIKYIKDIFLKANIKLKIIDADVFAAIRAINNNYECREGDISALVNIQNNGIQFILIDSGDYFSSSQVPLNLESIASDVHKSDDIIKIVTKELRKIILDNKLGEKIEDLSRIFLYGDLVLDNVLESLQNMYNVRIDRANPFRRLRFAPNVSVDEYIWSRPETFTVCVGCALR
jgi:Tfp pilus assembly PilM family ATPase